MVSHSAMSSSFTESKVRRSGSIVVSHNCGAVISPRPYAFRAAPVHCELIVVNVAPMGNAGEDNALGRIVNNVDHAPVPDSDSPMIFVSLELLASGRPGRFRQR